MSKDSRTIVRSLMRMSCVKGILEEVSPVEVTESHLPNSTAKCEVCSTSHTVNSCLSVTGAVSALVTGAYVATWQLNKANSYHPASVHPLSALGPVGLCAPSCNHIAKIWVSKSCSNCSFYPNTSVNRIACRS